MNNFWATHILEFVHELEGKIQELSPPPSLIQLKIRNLDSKSDKFQ